MMTEYHNPILPGFHPDPSICRVGKDFYLACSSFEYFPGVPVYHSRDLIHWDLQGYCFTAPEALPISGCASSAGIYAPTLRWHDGRFYLVTTNTSGKGHILTSAEKPEGPWTMPVRIDQTGIDPSVLFDGDKVYFCCNNLGDGGRQGIFLSEIDIRTGKTLTVPRCISYGTGGRYVEGPHLYHIGKFYYLLVSEGGTEYGHMIAFLRSEDPYGPYEACPHNPVLTHRDAGGYPIQAVGHGDLAEDTDGNWWMVCLGIRPLPGLLLHTLGRETFLAPVSWDADGWPVVNGGCRLEEEMEGPLPGSACIEAGSQAGAVRDIRRQMPEDQAAVDFTEDFSGGLRPEWRTLRAPLGVDRLRTQDGRLYLKAAGKKLSDDRSTPAMLCVPQTEFCVQCETTAVLPEASGDCWGLTAFYGADYHYDVYVKNAGGKTFACFRKRLDDMECELVKLPLPAGLKKIRLLIRADQEQYRFYVQPCIGTENPEKTAETGKTEAAGAPLLLGSGFAAGLATEGTHYMSFTGVMFGLFADSGEGIFDSFAIRKREERNV